MKQCDRCNALYPPRLASCPFCRNQEKDTAPKAWIRVRSRTDTVPVDLPPDSPPTVEVSPAPPSRRDDETVEIGPEYLDEHSEAILAALQDAVDQYESEAEVVHCFVDDIPTAKVKYLGADDSGDYDIEDLVDPPTPEAIAALLSPDKKSITAEDEDGDAVLNRVLRSLTDWSPEGLEAPSTDAHADRVRRANALVRRARELREKSENELREEERRQGTPTRTQPYETPGAFGLAGAVEFAGTTYVESSREFGLPSEPVDPIEEDWAFDDLEAPTALVLEKSQMSLAPRKRGVGRWVGLFAAGGLAATATWAFLAGLPIFVIAALAVGSFALLVLSLD